MAIQIIGNSGNVLEVDGPNWKATRITDRPIEFGSGGYYVSTVKAQTAAAPAAGANLVSFRWTSASLICLIRQVSISVQVATASTAGLPELAGYVATGFSVSDSGGTAVAIATGAIKKRSSFPNSSLGDFRFGSAGVLTAGTRTLSTQPFISVTVPMALGSLQSQLIGMDGPGDHPIVLSQNEGLVFQNVVALTGAVYQYKVSIDWAEVPSF